MENTDPQPTGPDLAGLVRQLLQLRDALEETALALNDYQCSLDSADSRAAKLTAVGVIERAKARLYSAGDEPT